jgi:hypothetical protein
MLTPFILPEYKVQDNSLLADKRLLVFCNNFMRSLNYALHSSYAYLVVAPAQHLALAIYAIYGSECLFAFIRTKLKKQVYDTVKSYTVEIYRCCCMTTKDLYDKKTDLIPYPVYSYF